MKPTKMHQEERSKLALIFWIQNNGFVGGLCVRVLDLTYSTWKRAIARIEDQSWEVKEKAMKQSRENSSQI